MWRVVQASTQLTAAGLGRRRPVIDHAIGSLLAAFVQIGWRVNGVTLTA